MKFKNLAVGFNLAVKTDALARNCASDFAELLFYNFAVFSYTKGWLAWSLNRDVRLRKTSSLPSFSLLSLSLYNKSCLQLKGFNNMTKSGGLSLTP